MSVYEAYVDFISKDKWYAHADRNDTGELAYHALGLAGESGEFVDLIKKVIRDHGYGLSMDNLSPELIIKMRDELGDVMWYLTQLAGMLGLTHYELMQLNMQKLREREATGGRQHVE